VEGNLREIPPEPGGRTRGDLVRVRVRLRAYWGRMMPETERFVTTLTVSLSARGSFALSTVCCCGNDAAHALRGRTVSAKSQRLASLVVLVVVC
jgi:hypothetical protein